MTESIRKSVLLPRTLTVFLVGFSGCGKTTIGKELADLLRIPFVDIDKLIEQRMKMPISDIFETRGEIYFRRLEARALKEVASKTSRGKIVALGGGAFDAAANRRLVKKTGISVYLSCAVDVLYRRLSVHTDRPLLDVEPRLGQTMREARLERIRSLLEKRKSNYEMADIRYTTTSVNPGNAAREVRRLIEKFYAAN